MYRCYLLNSKRSIAAVEVIECGDDTDARQKAGTILAARDDCSAVEVWDRGRQVHVQEADSGSPAIPSSAPS
jgi:hypothetical protein